MQKALPTDIFLRCVEDSTDAIMLTDERGFLVYVNRSWSLLYGYSQEEALGQKASLLHSGQHDPEFYEQMWRDILCPAKGHWVGEVVNRSKCGSLKTVLLTITPYRPTSRSGPIQGFMGIAVDYTAKREMEKRLAFQDKLALLGTLAGALAHEIGTPLGVIRGRAEMLAQEMESGFASEDVVAGRRNAKTILDQVDRISKVMDRILGFARSSVRSVMDPLAEPKKSVSALLEDVEALVHAHFRRSGVELEIMHPEGNLYVNFASSLEQILINLLINGVRAVEAIPATERRRVFLELKKEFSDEQGVFVWSIAVEDTGLGVDETIQSRIFEPFFTTDMNKGTGLGLAISAKIASDLGGGLSLEGPRLSLRGARFVLRLPEKTVEDMGVTSS